jgi:hypothetical protein
VVEWVSVFELIIFPLGLSGFGRGKWGLDACGYYGLCWLSGSVFVGIWYVHWVSVYLVKPNLHNFHRPSQHRVN